MMAWVPGIAVNIRGEPRLGPAAFGDVHWAQQGVEGEPGHGGDVGAAGGGLGRGEAVDRNGWCVLSA